MSQSIPESQEPANRFSKLPERILPENTTAEKETSLSAVERDDEETPFSKYGYSSLDGHVRL